MGSFASAAPKPTSTNTPPERVHWKGKQRKHYNGCPQNNAPTYMYSSCNTRFNSRAFYGLVRLASKCVDYLLCQQLAVSGSDLEGVCCPHRLGNLEPSFINVCKCAILYFYVNTCSITQPRPCNPPNYVCTSIMISQQVPSPYKMAVTCNNDFCSCTCQGCQQTNQAYRSQREEGNSGSFVAKKLADKYMDKNLFKLDVKKCYVHALIHVHTCTHTYNILAPQINTLLPRVTPALLQACTPTLRGSSRAPSSQDTLSGNLQVNGCECECVCVWV